MPQPEKPLLLPPKPSDHAQPSFQWEPLSSCVKEMWPLILREWESSGEQGECDPDWDRYFQLELAGNLSVLTLRLEGKIVGYAIVIVSNWIHQKNTKQALIDTYYILDEVRRFSLFKQLFDKIENELKEVGARSILLFGDEIYYPMFKRRKYRNAGYKKDL